MFKFETIDLQRIAVSLAGAAILSFISVMSAVGPAKAASPAAAECVAVHIPAPVAQ